MCHLLEFKGHSFKVVLISIRVSEMSAMLLSSFLLALSIPLCCSKSLFLDLFKLLLHNCFKLFYLKSGCTLNLFFFLNELLFIPRFLCLFFFGYH